MHRKATNVGIIQPRHDAAGEREVFQVFEYLPHFRPEASGDLFVALAVPGDRFAKIPPRAPPQANTGQRESTSRSI